MITLNQPPFATLTVFLLLQNLPFSKTQLIQYCIKHFHKISSEKDFKEVRFSSTYFLFQRFWEIIFSEVKKTGTIHTVKHSLHVCVLKY